MSLYQRRVWLSVIAVTALVACLAFLIFTGVDSAIEVAPGLRMEIKSVTVGTNHQFVSGPPWSRFLYPMVPASWRARLAVKLHSHSTPTESLMIWTEWQLSRGGTNPVPTEASIANLAGYEADGVRPATMTYHQAYEAVAGYSFASFPRRDKKMMFRIYRRDNAGSPHLMAQTEVDNPVRTDHAQWTASPPPLTVSTQGLDFTLAELRLGAANESGWRWNFLPPAHAVFRVTTNGGNLRTWRVDAIEVHDATGNLFPVPRLTLRPTTLETTFHAPFWPSENAYRLRTSFSRLHGFMPEELLSITNLSLGTTGSPPAAVPMINRSNVTVSLNVNRTLPFRFGMAGRPNPNTEVQVRLLPPDFQVDIVDIVDPLGKTVFFTVERPGPGVIRALFYTTPEATTVTLTCAIHRSVVVDFLARPSGIAISPP